MTAVAVNFVGHGNKPMSTETSLPESSPKRRPAWHRSLWFRIPVVLLCIWTICLLACWWPSRSAWSVFGVNGMVEMPQGTLQNRLRNSTGFANYASRYLAMDTEVISAWLIGTGVEDEWLVRLSHFPQLRQISLDGGQVGPGLRHVAGLPGLKQIHVSGHQMRNKNGWIDHIDSKISARHFLLVPQLETVTFSGFREQITDLDQLKTHPHLHSLYLGEIEFLSDALKQLEACPNIQHLSINQSAPLDDATIESLGRLRHVKVLALTGTKKSDDLNARLKVMLPETQISWMR